MSAKSTPEDQLRRPLRDLRISVTDRCNFRCTYCMPAEIFHKDYAFLAKEKLLTFEEMTRLIRIFADLGVRKIRITGGEPLVRGELPSLIRMIREVPGIEDVAMTTNGLLLAKHAVALQQAGLHRVTVSLDGLDDEVFMALNGVGCRVEPILHSIDTAIAAGLEVKVNMLVKKGVNEHQILPMARYFKEKGISLRFIEFMDVGNSNGWKLEHVVPSKEILQRIHEELPLESLEPNYYGEVAKRHRYADGSSEIGFITSVTQAFCSTCTRARLSAEGSLYTCLFAEKGHDLRSLLRSEDADDEAVEAEIIKVWEARLDRYSDVRLSQTKGLRNKVEMSHIGG